MTALVFMLAGISVTLDHSLIAILLGVTIINAGFFAAHTPR